MEEYPPSIQENLGSTPRNTQIRGGVHLSTQRPEDYVLKVILDYLVGVSYIVARDLVSQ